MAYAAGYAAVLAGCALLVPVLARARWTWRTPRVAILSWQALGLALGLSLIGLPLAIGLAPYEQPTGFAAVQFATHAVRPDLPLTLWHLAAVAVALVIGARLLWVTATCLTRALRAQHRHRRLLAMVGRDDPAAPGALVLDHPTAAAYCLPGLRPTVVVSAGTLRLLAPDELDAVLSHEQAHAVERHDLVLLPFTALVRALRPARWLRRASDAVALLVEMRADDRARRRHTDARLAAALRRFAAVPGAGAPAGTLDAGAAAGTLGAADLAVQARLQRLGEHHGPPRLLGAATLLVCITLLVVPVALLLA